MGSGRPSAASTGAPREVAIPDEPLTAALDRAAQRWPDRAAVDFLGAATTYRDLADSVARGAQVLLDLGVRPGDRVALVMPNSTSHVVAFYAALRIGAVVVEHNPTYSTGELAHQLADSGAVVALVWEKAVPRVLESLPRTALKAVVAMDLSADLSRGKRLALRLPLPSATGDVSVMPYPSITRPRVTCSHFCAVDAGSAIAPEMAYRNDVRSAPDVSAAAARRSSIGGTAGRNVPGRRRCAARTSAGSNDGNATSVAPTRIA